MGRPRKPKAVNAAPATARRRGHQLPSRVTDALWEALRAEAKRERRHVSQTVILLLEEALRARGREVPPHDAP
jgi:hypothetical protein